MLENVRLIHVVQVVLVVIAANKVAVKLLGWPPGTVCIAATILAAGFVAVLSLAWWAERGAARRPERP